MLLQITDETNTCGLRCVEVLVQVETRLFETIESPVAKKATIGGLSDDQNRSSCVEVVYIDGEVNFFNCPRVFDGIAVAFVEMGSA